MSMEGKEKTFTIYLTAIIRFHVSDVILSRDFYFTFFLATFCYFSHLNIKFVLATNILSYFFITNVHSYTKTIWKGKIILKENAR